MAMTLTRKRARLLAGCAMAVAIGTQARAQSYPDRALQGASTIALGAATFSRSANIDTITINASQTIINWNPETGQNALPSGVIDFLPAGKTANFVNGGSIQNYTVLNRILPSDTTRPIAINGTVNSAIIPTSGQPTRGGSVWFYTPGGIIAGPTAVFNVGNLVLTANDIDATQGLFDASGAIRFRGTAGSNSQINIQAGAKINLTNAGSYLALVAPRVAQGGDVKINGSAAYIAAESVDVRINSGLFDINFVAGGGTSATGAVITHTGTTTSDTGTYTNNGLFFAAMPKNQAISMLLGGTIGYTPAATVSVDNGVIVMSAGSNVVGGAQTIDYTAPKLASISLGGGTYRSTLVATATDGITIKPATGQSANFSGTVDLRGTSLLVEADAASILVGRALTLNASAPLQGGIARIAARNGGTVDATSSIFLDAQGREAAHNQTPLNGDNVKGGTVSITVNNGRVATPGTLALSAYAEGGTGTNLAGSGEGGIATIDVRNTSANGGFRAANTYVDVSGEVGYGNGGAGIGGGITVTADAAELQSVGLFLTAEGGGSRGDGARGVGGTIDLTLNSAITNFTQLSMDASGNGGRANRAGNNGGAATGGAIDVSWQGVTANLTQLFANAGAVGGAAANTNSNGGAATGGSAAFQLTSSTLSINGNSFNPTVGAIGGTSFSGNGGNATGGNLTLGLSNSILNADVNLIAPADGGAGKFNRDTNGDGISDAFGRGGNATGGNITLAIDNSTINAPGFVGLNAAARGGVGPIGGNALGATILIDFASGAINTVQSSSFTAAAWAQGGSTALNDFDPRVDAARTGDATGGTVTLLLGSAQSTATMGFANVTLDASAFTDPEAVGDVGNQGDVRGGTVTATVVNSTLTATNGLLLDASAEGGIATSNYGGGQVASSGNAYGGSATLTSTDSFIDTDGVSVLANGDGGFGRRNDRGENGEIRRPSRGGLGTGGTARLTAERGQLLGEILVDAGGTGGDGGLGEAANGAAGGAGTGGTATASFNLTRTDDTISVYSRARGGAGGNSIACDALCGPTPPFGGGDGGAALAGNARLDMVLGSASLDTITVSSTATGGDGGTVDPDNFGVSLGAAGGGNGGNATAGNALFNLTLTAGENSFDTFDLTSEAFGGQGGVGPLGGTGGNATAGNLDFAILGGQVFPDDLTFTARAVGGDGGGSAFGTGAAGGNATAGVITIGVSGDLSALDIPSDSASFDASAAGGDGADGLLPDGNGGRGGNATSGGVAFVASQGRIYGITSDDQISLQTSGGFGGDGATGLTNGGAGGNGGVGGDATGGFLSFAASNNAQIDFPDFTFALQTIGGVGGSGGDGGQGTAGATGSTGGTGQNGGTGATGGNGGNGGNGALGGNVRGGSFTATSSTGATISFGQLEVDLLAFGGRAGGGGTGGTGGRGGTGGTGGIGVRNPDGTFINPGAGGTGGTGGIGGAGGTGGDSGAAAGGSFSFDVDSGTITANSLAVRSQFSSNFGSSPSTFTYFGGQGGYAGSGGEGGYGGNGGFGAQENTGPRGTDGGRGIFGTFGNYGQSGNVQGGLISLSADTSNEILGTLTTGNTLLDTSAGVTDGEIFNESGPQGEIHITANGPDTVLSFNGLNAYAGGVSDSTNGYDGLIEITGTGTEFDFNNTFLSSAGNVSVALNGDATILSGETFSADANNIYITHNGLTTDGATINADEVHLRASANIDTTSSRLLAHDLIDLQSGFILTLGSARVRGGSVYADAEGPHGAELRAAVGQDPFRDTGIQAGDLTVNGDLEADGSIYLTASNDVAIATSASLSGNNRVGLTAGGDVTVESDAMVKAGVHPLAENGYGSFDPFDQNGQLTIIAGSPTRTFPIVDGDIASVRIAGSLDAGNGAISLSGAAIDGTGSFITAKYVRADIAGATRSGSTDLGRLTGGCTEGLICLGALTVSDTLRIGTIGVPFAASITDVTTVRELDVNATGNITFGDGLSAFTIAGTDYFHATSAHGDILLNGPVTLSGGADFVLSTTGSILGPQGTIISPADLVLTAPGGIALGGLNIIGTSSLNSANGTIDVSGIRGGTVNATGRAVSLSGPGAFTSTNLLATGTALDVNFTGNVTLGSATAAGAVGIRSTAGNISIASIGSAQQRPTNVYINAFGNATLGDAAAASAINLTAGSLATISGLLTAELIRIRSGDIAIGGNARIGAVGTTSQANFTSFATTATVGGSSTGSGYRMSEAELQRVSANNVLFATQPDGQLQDAIDPNATPGLTLDTLSLTATQPQQGFANLSSTGTLRFQTQGTMRVVGPVRVTGAGTGNRLELAAGPAIQVRPGGSASLVNGTDLAGTLVLTAGDIIASDATTLSGLAAAPNIAAQDTLLGANAGTTDDTGFFAANAIQANVANGIYVQNTGVSQQPGAKTNDQRRGLTVGSGGLAINSSTDSPINVVVNGRQVSASAAGGFITGLDFIPLVNLGPPSGIVTGSTINGCIIGGICGGIVPPPPPPPLDLGIDPGIIARDTIEDLVEKALAAATNSANTPNALIELRNFTSAVDQPLIEDPVTGSGNDDLLADKDGKPCDPSTETCTKD